MNFGKRLAKARTDAKYTQETAAGLLDLSSKSVLSAYERGQNMPSAATLAAMADLYDTSADYLLGRTDRIKPDFEGLKREHTEAARELSRLPDHLQSHIIGLIHSMRPMQRDGLIDRILSMNPRDKANYPGFIRDLENAQEAIRKSRNT